MVGYNSVYIPFTLLEKKRYDFKINFWKLSLIKLIKLGMILLLLTSLIISLCNLDIL